MKRTASGCRESCGGRPLKRREFLGACAACALGAGVLAAWSPRAARAAEGAGKPRVRLVFTHVPSTGPVWPNIGYDFDKRKKELTDKLIQACPNVEFLPVTAMNGGEARKVVEGGQDIDGYLVYMVGLWTGAPQAIAASGKPTIYADDLYGGSGEYLIAYSAARRAGQKVVGVSSSRVQDVAEAAKCFEILKKPGATADDFLSAARAAAKKTWKAPGDLACPDDPVKAIEPQKCLEKLRASTLVVVGGGWPGVDKAIQEVFGTKVVQIPHKDLHEAHQKADKAQAAEWAEKWIKAAEKVLEPSKDEIVNSAAMYLAELEILKRHNAQAITVNCLGGFYGGHLKGYPCLGFCQLNNDGLVGGCEGDVVSAFTMMAVGGLVGRPGYISDPVIDTSKNQIIYAHCVAPTKVFGPAGPSNPCHLRSHSEDRQGASMRSLMPLGRLTTTLQIHAGRKEMIVHQAKTVENVDEDKACRTKLAAEPKGDLDKLMTQWDQWGWHRVTFYGDLRIPLEGFCKAAGLKMVEEA
jgi:hypothetical protein